MAGRFRYFGCIKFDPMKKDIRQKVYDKFGGKCAYCGCELQKGWHIDHAEPIGRRYKILPSGVYHIKEDRLAYPHENTYKSPEFEFRKSRQVSDGCDHPERDCFDNYMPACPSCNINKHSCSVEQFRRNIAHYLESLNSYSTNYKFAKRYGLVKETGEKVVFYFEKIKDHC